MHSQHTKMTFELFNDIDQPRSPGGIEELVDSDRKFERVYVVIENCLTFQGEIEALLA